MAAGTQAGSTMKRTSGYAADPLSEVSQLAASFSFRLQIFKRIMRAGEPHFQLKAGSSILEKNGCAWEVGCKYISKFYILISDWGQLKGMLFRCLRT